MPYADTSSGRLFYAVSRGQGLTGRPALVLIHGAGGTRLQWPAELRRLPGTTVYTLDLPGHGRSTGASFDNIEDYAEAAVGLLDWIAVERAVFAGHSMGGAIALELALDHAARVAGLVLVATRARLRVAPAILDGIPGDFEEAVALITRWAWSPGASHTLTEAGRQVLLDTKPGVVLNDFTACDRFDVMEQVGEIRTPTLVVAGTADQLTPFHYSRFLADRIAGAQCVVIEGAGHMVMLEQPIATARAVQTFLEGLDIS